MRDILVADTQELENLDASEISLLGDSMRRNLYRRKMVIISYAQTQMEQLNRLEEIRESENPRQCGINP